MSLDDPADISSPYFLHPNENSALVLVSPMLTSLNYHSWARAMRMALLSKNKLKFVDGTIQAPAATDPLFPAWERCNTMVISWLHHSISPAIVTSILWIDFAYEIWRDLHERFSQGDVFCIPDLQEEIFALKQGDRTVTDYFTDLKILWDELLQFWPVPSCSCHHPCSCGALTILRRYHENDCVIWFLKGLNDCFAGVRSEIMLIDPLPSLNKAFSMVMQQERQLTSVSSQVLTSNIVRHPFSARKPQNKSSVDSHRCTYCGGSRHTIDTCYKKHGYPPGYKSKRPTSRVNLAVDEKVTPASESSSSVSTDSNVALTSMQIQQLLALLPSSSQSSHITSQVLVETPESTEGISSLFSSSWIVDTGATDHICHNLSLFASYTKIKPISITLPNGTHVVANFSGTVIFSTDFHLTHVLYVPQFSFNLLSVTQATSRLPCSFRFSNHSCCIQALPSMKMMGTAKVFNGLYVLELSVLPTPSPSTKVFAVTSVSPASLWHHRLGHLSDSRLKSLYSNISSSPFVANLPCKTCHLAKQNKLVFPLSQSVYKALFDLIHVDIWGPNGIISIIGHRYFLTIVDDFSRFTWIVLLKSKSEARFHLLSFRSLVETQFSLKIKVIRTDNGPEFTIPSFYASNRILHQIFCVKTPQENGLVKRKHQHILNVSRALLFHAHLPKIFWSFAVLNSVFLINRTPTPLLSNSTPFE